MPRSANIATPIHGSSPDLDHYLRSLYQRLEPNKVAKTVPSSKPPTAAEENLKHAKEICGRVYRIMTKGPARIFLQSFRRGGSRIRQRNTFDFDVDLIFVHTVPRGAFTVIKGPRTKTGISPNLTRQEKAYVRADWHALMEEDFLSPVLVHIWVTAVLKRAFNRLDDVAVLLSSQYPNINVIISRKDINGNPSPALTFRIQAHVPILCKVPTIMLRHPLPMQLPYSHHGMQLLQQMRRKLAVGRVMITAVPHQAEQPQRRLSSRQSRRSLELNPQPTHEWHMDYSAVEYEILSQVLRLRCMETAAEAYMLISAIKNQRGEDWDTITPSVLQSTMLWLIKRVAHRIKTVSDWFFGLMNTLKCVLRNQYCPGYLEPTSNVFTPCERTEAKNAIRDIDKLMEDSEKKKDFYYS